jgi:hypothetical protein
MTGDGFEQWLREVNADMLAQVSLGVDVDADLAAVKERAAGCPRDTNGDGDCGRPACPLCGLADAPLPEPDEREITERLPMEGGCPGCGKTPFVIVAAIYQPVRRVQEPWGYSANPALHVGWRTDCGCRIGGFPYVEAGLPYGRWQLTINIPAGPRTRYAPEAVTGMPGKVINAWLPGHPGPFPVKVLAAKVIDDGKAVRLTVVREPQPPEKGTPVDGTRESGVGAGTADGLPSGQDGAAGAGRRRGR